MSRFSVDYDLRSERLGGFVVAFTGEVEAELSWEPGGPRIDVSAVYSGGRNLFRGEPWCQMLAAEVAAMAEKDERIAEKLTEEEGVFLAGFPGDPSAKLVRLGRV